MHIIPNGQWPGVVPGEVVLLRRNCTGRLELAFVWGVGGTSDDAKLSAGEYGVRHGPFKPTELHEGRLECILNRSIEF